MLVLSRKINQSIVIGDNIEIMLVDIRGDQIKLGINAPRDVKIFRKEVYEEIESQNLEASKTNPEQLNILSSFVKNKLEIDENEALFKKILSSKKTLYVSDPFSSLSLKIKFDEKDRENVSHMIFIPIQDEEGSLKSFFIGLSSN